MKGTASGVTTAYVGSNFEWTGSVSTMKRYYYAGGSRVAVRTGASMLNFLLSDHLGGTAVTTDLSGVRTSEVRYMPFGSDRYSYGTAPTTMRYTGQRQESTIGLYFYGARWYDPALGRFTSADTIVAGGVQGYDRYIYVNNNPVSYTDPSGHSPWYVAGWDPNYAQKQDGSTCAVVSIAVVLSIETSQKHTQKDVQGLFPLTYIGIGASPHDQAEEIDKLPGAEATFAQGTRKDLEDCLKNDTPVIVSFTVEKYVGHAVVAIGYDPATGEIQFFDPQDGIVKSESDIVDKYGKPQGFNTFDDLWANSNLFIPSNSMVTIDIVTPPSGQASSGGGGGGGGNPFTPEAK